MASFSMSRDSVGSSPSAKWEIYWSNGYFYVRFTKNSDGYIGSGSYTCYLKVDNTTWNFTMNAATGATGTTTTNQVYLNSVSAPTSSSTISFYTTSTTFTSTGIVPSSNPITGTFRYAITIEDRVSSTSGTLLGSSIASIPAGTTSKPSTYSGTTYTGYNYSSDSPTSFTATADMTVYRLFSAITYIISYNANTQSGDGAYVPASQSKKYGETLTLSSATPYRYCSVYLYSNGSLYTTLKSYRTFQNYNTSKSGTGTTYLPNGKYTANSAATLYAQWNSAYPAVTLPTLTQSGSIFKGWYTSASGGTKVGNGGSSYIPAGSIVLYAQWDKGSAQIYTGSSFTTAIPYIYYNGEWIQAIPYIYNGSSWEIST